MIKLDFNRRMTTVDTKISLLIMPRCDEVMLDDNYYYEHKLEKWNIKPSPSSRWEWQQPTSGQRQTANISVSGGPVTATGNTHRG